MKKNLERVWGKNKMKRLLFIFCLLAPAITSMGQQKKNLAEKLGYPKDARLLIIHGDDIGLSHSTNAAYVRAFEEGALTTGSVMVPCPWFSEAADYFKNHPGLDIGVHLTLNAEWKYFKWGGTAFSCEIPSLLDRENHFYPSIEELRKNVISEEAKKECKAQIDKAIEKGIQPTHLDTHMGSVVYIPQLIPVYLSLAKEYKLPYLFPAEFLPMLPPEVKKLISPDDVLLDHLFMLSPELISGRWIDPYLKAISEMKPGLTEMIVHLSFDNDEMQAITKDHNDFGSKWRQNDLEAISSPEFKKALKDNNIIRVTWNQIREIMYPRN
jgi:chitin disaccharide deacetylase